MATPEEIAAENRRLYGPAGDPANPVLPSTGAGGAGAPPPPVDGGANGSAAPPPEEPVQSPVDTAAAAPAPQAQPAPTKYVSDPGSAAQTDPYKVAAYIPAGSQTSVSRTDLGQAGKDAMKAQEEALSATGKAQEQQSAVAQERAKTIAEGQEARALYVDQVASRAAERTQKALAAQQARADKITSAVDQNLAANRDIDANRYWAKQSTGQMIGNLIAIATSGFGAALQARGGNPNARNGAMDMINQFIERDIETQKMQMQARERGIQLQVSAYQVARDAGASEEEAQALVESKHYQALMAQNEAKLAKLGPGQERANLQALQAELGQKLADKRLVFAQLNATHVQQTEAQQPVFAGQVQAANDAAQRKAAGLVEYDPKLQTRFGQAADAAQKREVDKADLELKQADLAVKTFEKYQHEKYLTPSQQRAFDSARGKYLAFMHGDLGAKIGRFSPEVVKLMDPSVPSRDAWAYLSGADESMTKAARENLDQIEQTLRSQMVKTVK